MKDLDAALAKKQLVVDTVSHDNGNWGRLYSHPDKHDCDYHHVEVAWYRESVNVAALNWNDREEHWTYVSHFKAPIYARDLEEADIDLEIAFQQCLKTVEILNTAAENLQKEVARANELTQNIHALQRDNTLIHASLQDAHSNITTHLESMNDIQRACVIGEKCSTPGSKYLELEIDRIGFDANIAATFAINRKNNSLLSLVIKHGPNFDTHLLGEQTLLQVAVATENQSIIQTILAATPNCVNSLLSALSQNDNETVISILKFYPQMATTLIFDTLTALDYAIGNDNHDLTQYLLENHKETINTKNINGESVFKIALLSGDHNTIKIVAEYADLDEEYQQLIAQKEDILIKIAVDLGLFANPSLGEFNAHEPGLNGAADMHVDNVT